MFGRQWFSEYSQIGLSQAALDFEILLRSGEFELARKTLLNNYQKKEISYWSRMWHRLKWLSKRQYSGKDAVIKYIFDGFWPDMETTNCQILDLFMAANSNLSWIETDSAACADIVFSSCYANGLSHIRKNSPQAMQILFLGENVRPSFSDYDLSLSCDQPTYNGRNIYLPLWMLEIDWFKKPYYKDRKTYPLSIFSANKVIDISQRKNAVCFIGNNYEAFRTTTLQMLEREGIRVEYFGSQSNPVVDKLYELSEYKYTLCFENSFCSGYTTEKPIHSYLAGCKGIYWGGVDPILNIEKNSSFFMLNSNISLEVQVSRLAAEIKNEKHYIQEQLLNETAVLSRFKGILVKINRVLSQFISG